MSDSEKRTLETIEMLEMLPEEEQRLANELIKRLVLAWDPDFTKVTPAEKQAVEEGRRDIVNGNTMSHDDVKRRYGIN